MASGNVEIEVALHVHQPAGRAVLVSLDGENASARWLPRSRIVALHETGRTTKGTNRVGQVVTLPMAQLVIPEWLAIKEGLV